MPRPASDDLTALLADVAAHPTAWEFFALARGLEQASPDAPPIGTALNPADELVDWAHEPTVSFPRATVAGSEPGADRPRIRSQHLGLTGPMGPLPLHMTEIALAEKRGGGPRPMGDFLDLISARMIQCFYRAWSTSEPAAQADRPRDDRFAAALGAVSGATALAFVGGAERPPASDDGFDDWRRLPYAGHLQSLRSASAIADTLSHLLGRPVMLEESVGRTRPIPADARTRIGTRQGRHQQLGAGATLGGRFFAVEWDVALHVRARDEAELDMLLPGGDAHRLLLEAAAVLLPPSLDWTIGIVIGNDAAPPARLAGAGRQGARLGLASWVAPGRGARDRRDVGLDGRKYMGRMERGGRS